MDDNTWTVGELQHLRNETIPRLFSGIDEVKKAIENLAVQMNAIQTKVAVIETKIEVMARFFWGVLGFTGTIAGGLIIWLVQSHK